jgi:hypothetical protein
MAANAAPTVKLKSFGISICRLLILTGLTSKRKEIKMPSIDGKCYPKEPLTIGEFYCPAPSTNLA